LVRSRSRTKRPTHHARTAELKSNLWSTAAGRAEGLADATNRSMKPTFWTAFSLITHSAGALGQSIVVRPQLSSAKEVFKGMTTYRLVYYSSEFLAPPYCSFPSVGSTGAD